MFRSESVCSMQINMSIEALNQEASGLLIN